MNVIPIIRPFLGAEEAAAASDAIASGWVAQGPRVAEFERNFAARVGATQAIAVSSCTTGLHLAMHLLGLGAGDEVVVPSLSFIATQNAVRYVGATPVFCDVEETTQNISAATIEPCLTPATKAVMVVHQGGIPADVKALSGSSIRLHGFMIPIDQAENITQFALVPSLFACCFGQPPQIQHQIVVHTPKGKAVGYFPDEIVCEGILKVEEKKDDGYIVSVFEMDVQSVKPAAK